jgi:hypothetical protein
MKKIVFLFLLALTAVSSCTQEVKKSEKVAALENTLISVSFYSDSTMDDPSALLQSFEKVNKAIDSIGYPDAGYKLWRIQSDTSKNIDYMIEGLWPDQEIYNSIHMNELYTSAMKDLQQWSKNLKNVFYNRFVLVK